MRQLFRIDHTTISQSIAGVEAGCILCHSGLARLRVDAREYTLAARSMFVYPPYASIEVIAADCKFSGMLCAVDHPFVLSAIKPITWSHHLQLIVHKPVVTLSAETFSNIEELIIMISKRADEAAEQNISHLLLDCLWKALAYEVLGAYMASCEDRPMELNPRDSIVISFQQSLKTDITRHREVKYYADLQGLSSRYFSTAIRKLTGHPPLYWIVRAVIAEAQTLMSDSTLSLKEITYLLNFQSQTFFSRWYRQYTGETPSLFRNRLKKG